MDYERLIAAAERHKLPNAAALAAEHRRAMAGRIAAKYGFRLIDIDPDGVAIAQLVELMEKDL